MCGWASFSSAWARHARRRDNADQHNEERRPAAEGNGFACSGQGDAEIDGMPHAMVVAWS
jgi:hypothetical protein